MEKKTVADVLKEYKNRQNNLEYKWIGVLEDVGQYEQFENISNLKNTKDKYAEWLEFDTKSRNETSHVKVLGHIVKYEQIIND